MYLEAVLKKELRLATATEYWLKSFAKIVGNSH